MNHPYELLTGYVDGDLPEGERAIVDAHLEVCGACRNEIVLANGARRALRTLTDVPVPADVSAPALAEVSATSRAATSAGTTPRWYRAAGLAAAAAIVALVVVALPRLGDDATGPGTAALRTEDATATGEVQTQDKNWTRETLANLAATARSAGAPAAPPAAEATASDAVDPATALECLRAAYPAIEGSVPVLLIDARFEGTPAYLGVFESGAGEGQPADRRTALAASSQQCRFLHLTSARI